MNFNISIIAGYDVLADDSFDHVDYVFGSRARSLELGADLFIFVGGATNPDYPEKTEAEANCAIFRKLAYIDVLEVGENQGEITAQLIRGRQLDNEMDVGKSILSVKILPVGNTSAETLEEAKAFIQNSGISVQRIILCAEQSRLAGFLMDALMVGLLDLSDEIVAYGHPFPESKNNFDSQREKMIVKILSHRSKIFRFIRNMRQKIHQRKVAWEKRRGR